MPDAAGWEMQQECERERWQLLMEALDAAADGKATPAQMAFIARECGIKDYRPHAHARSASVG